MTQNTAKTIATTAAERTVKINKHEGFDDAVNEYNVGSKVQEAIGYLAAWALHDSSRHVKAKIYLLKDGNMQAFYYDKSGQMSYVIGAVLRTGVNENIGENTGYYSFHS